MCLFRIFMMCRSYINDRFIMIYFIIVISILSLNFNNDTLTNYVGVLSYS